MPDVDRRAIRELIDSCVVKEPAARPGQTRQRRRFGDRTAVAAYLLNAVWSLPGLLGLMFVAAVVTFILVANVPDLNVRDALLAAGCGGVLAPVVAIAAIRFADFVLRATGPAIGVALAAGLIGLLGRVFL